MGPEAVSRLDGSSRLSLTGAIAGSNVVQAETVHNVTVNVPPSRSMRAPRQLLPSPPPFPNRRAELDDLTGLLDILSTLDKPRATGLILIELAAAETGLGNPKRDCAPEAGLGD